MKSSVIGLSLLSAVAGCHVHHAETTTPPATKPAVPIVQPTTDPAKMAKEPVVEMAPVAVAPVATKPVAEVRPTTAPSDEKPVFRPEPVDLQPRTAEKAWFARVSILPPVQPSALLLQHARSDSPIPLQQYPQQKTYSVSDFPLGWETSAATIEKQFGPPAQLADYSSVWYVYRLNHRKELWLHFTQPDNTHLLSADVITPDEDGYNRERVFSAMSPR